MFNFCSDCAYLSVNRVNGIGENSNFSSQLRAELNCASPIPYHVLISCATGHSFNMILFVVTLQARIDQYFTQLTKIAGNKSTPPRISPMIQEVIAIRRVSIPDMGKGGGGGIRACC